MKWLSIFLVLVLTGCTTSSDQISFYMINKRINELEEKIQSLESKKTLPQNVQVAAPEESVPKYFLDIDKLDSDISDLRSLVEHIDNRVFILEKKKIEDRPKEPVIPLYSVTAKSVVTNSIWLQLRNGSRKKIDFRLENGKWYGAKGEQYDEFPTEKEAKTLYYE